VIQTYGRIPPAIPAGVSLVGAGREGHRVVTGQRILQAQSDPSSAGPPALPRIHCANGRSTTTGANSAT
jgi:hypothetical protein